MIINRYELEPEYLQDDGRYNTIDGHKSFKPSLEAFILYQLKNKIDDILGFNDLP